MIEQAMRYAAMGWQVIPVHGVISRNGVSRCSCGKRDCSSPGKHPILAKWEMAGTTDPATIGQWWRKWSWANVGLVTGRASGFVVLDIDVDKGGEESLAALLMRFGPLPDTPEVITGSGGRHIYFRHPGVRVANSASKVGMGVDVRGDGGFVVAPPSLHITNRRYDWEASSEPDVVPLAPMPSWITQELVNREGSMRGRYAATAVSNNGKVIDGKRNAYLTSIAGSLRRYGLSGPAIKAALLAENAARCNPPLSDEEVVEVARSIMRYEGGTIRWQP